MFDHRIHCAFILALLVPACAVAPSDPQTETEGPSAKTQSTAPTGGHGPTLIANSTRYKDAGAKPATGRSGGATLVARALLGKDGNTDLELATAALDTTAVQPGNISKVQLKVLATDGTPILTHNDNGLTGGGYVDEKVPALQRGANLDVLAHVGGIDGHRTDVVPASVSVKLRPDLAASDLRAPKRSWQNGSVLVSATIRELNGDVGARSNCVLSVDGAEVDHADGIWVDAGGTVSCRFQYRFAKIGTHAISVAALSVVPGDWDTSNNAVTGSLEVVAPVDVDYSASAIDQRAHAESDRRSHYDYDYCYGSSGWGWGYWVCQYGSGDWANQWIQDSHAQSAQFDAWFPRAITFPLTTLKLSETSDGTTVSSTDFSGRAADFTTTLSNGGVTTTESCVQSQDSGGAAVFVCTDTVSDGTAHTHVHIARAAGDVTYHSFNFQAWYNGANGCYWNYWGTSCWSYSYGGGYQYNYGSSSSWGTPVTMGSAYDYALQLTDGDLAYRPVNAHVALTPFSWPWSSGNPTCWTGGGPANCYYENHSSSGVSGATSGVQSSAP